MVRVWCCGLGVQTWPVVAFLVSDECTNPRFLLDAPPMELPFNIQCMFLPPKAPTARGHAFHCAKFNVGSDVTSELAACTCGARTAAGSVRSDSTAVDSELSSSGGTRTVESGVTASTDDLTDVNYDSVGSLTPLMAEGGDGGRSDSVDPYVCVVVAVAHTFVYVMLAALYWRRCVMLGCGGGWSQVLD